MLIAGFIQLTDSQIIVTEISILFSLALPCIVVAHLITLVHSTYYRVMPGLLLDTYFIDCRITFLVILGWIA